MHTRFETKSCWLPCTCLPCNKEGAWLSFKWHPNDMLLPCRPQFRSYERITKNFLNWVNWFFMLSATGSSFGWTYNSIPLLKPSRSTVSIPSSQFTSGATKDCFLENICSKKQILVADPGERPAPPPPPVIFRPNWGPKGRKKVYGDPPFFLFKGLNDRCPPPLSQSLDPALNIAQNFL